MIKSRYLTKSKLYLALLLCLVGGSGFSQSVQLQSSLNSPQGAYAAERLSQSLISKGFTVAQSQGDYVVSLNIAAGSGAEGYSIKADGKHITITGGDERGLIYGSLALAESVNNGADLKTVKSVSEKPRLAFRAIKFDLPWDTYRHSYALALHMETCKDLDYWKAFLDMMVENRFNALTLWNLHPYPYMIRAKNFPEATPFNEDEMQQWQRLFHGILGMAKERGIETYLIPFNIFVSPEFSKAHNVAMDNLQHDFFVNGDTSAIIKRYTRESVTQVLQEYPELTGFGLTLGEGMGGMTPQQREDWMKATILEGMKRVNRKSKLVHRIPFSSTTGSLGVTSVETEQLTRKEIEKEGEMSFIEGPVWADLKFNWSHAHSTPKLIKVHGGKLYDTYFKPVPTKYKITWTARNEDFFCLRWGVPQFVRDHINANSQPYVGGYFLGSETYIPAKDYFTSVKGPLTWKYAFERQWLFYKIWGRLLYNPDTPDDIFQSEFTRRYGNSAAHLLEASALAGKTPLRLAASFDFTWDFSLYSEGMLALNSEVKRVEYISVDRQIRQPTTDPDYVSVMDYVKAAASGDTFQKNQITPLMLAEMLEQDNNKALALVKDINTSGNTPLMYEVADIKVWANLGLHLAEKLRGAVALQTYRTQGGDENKKQAVSHLQNALKFWDIVIGITSPIYNEMPLVHYSEQNGERSKANQYLKFHWKTIRPDVARDVQLARQAEVEVKTTGKYRFSSATGL